MVDNYPLTVYIEYRKGVFILCTQAKENESAQTAAACTGGCAACVKHKHRDKESKEYKCLISRLRRIEGQVRGVEKMVEDDRYCVDISNQLLATQSLLKSANQQIMRAHIEGCVREALQTDHIDPKLEEAFQLLERMAQS